MSRFIDADDFFRTFEELDIEPYNNFPTADVIPIEWIKEQKDKCFPYSVTALTLNGLLTEWEGREDGE